MPRRGRRAWKGVQNCFSCTSINDRVCEIVLFNNLGTFKFTDSQSASSSTLFSKYNHLIVFFSLRFVSCDFFGPTFRIVFSNCLCIPLCCGEFTFTSVCRLVWVTTFTSTVPFRDFYFEYFFSLLNRFSFDPVRSFDFCFTILTTLTFYLDFFGLSRSEK